LGAELRWILLGLSVPLLAGIWWWTARRSSQARGNDQLRDPVAGNIPEPAPPLDPRYADDNDEDGGPQPESRDWGVSPFEPLSIRTADYDRVPILDGPMMVQANPAPAQTPAAAAYDATAAISARPAPTPAVPPAPGSPAAASATDDPATAGAVPSGESSDRLAPARPDAAELQRIVTVRVCTADEERWSGTQLMAALELHGLAFGRYQVFHRRHADGRSLFCVASLIEPGTFDIAAMADQQFRGVTLFAVLPGPLPPLETLDELLATARGLADELKGMVQDSKGVPLSPQRAAVLRDDLERFQGMLPVH
jgi:cell division protein ZipA